MFESERGHSMRTQCVEGSKRGLENVHTPKMRRI